MTLQTYKTHKTRVTQSDNKREHRGGSRNFAEDGEKASEAGRTGGEANHGGRSS